MLTVKDPHTVLQPLHCMSYRLGRRYGSLPLLAATQRMRDTLWRPEDSTARRRLAATKGRIVDIVLDDKTCEFRGLASSGVVDGVSMHTKTDRPYPPQRRRF
jgi:hypothetical protein